MNSFHYIKRLIFRTFSLLFLVIILSACSNKAEETISQLTEQNETLESELTIAKSTVKSTQSELDTAKKETKSTKEKLANVESEYDAYKNEMKPYEGIAKEEAEAREAELAKKREEEEAEKKRLAAEEKEAKKQAAAEEKARKEAELAQGYETGTTYDQLARTPDDFILEKVKFYGKVVQVMEGNDTTAVRLAVDDNYDSIMYCEIPKELIENNRILDDDYVTFSGTSFGLFTYSSTMGGEITIPSMIVDIVDR